MHASHKIACKATVGSSVSDGIAGSRVSSHVPSIYIDAATLAAQMLATCGNVNYHYEISDYCGFVGTNNTVRRIYEISQEMAIAIAIS